MGQDSVVGSAIHCGLDSLAVESQLGQNFLHPPRPALVLMQPPIHWVLHHLQGLSGRGVVLTTQPHLVPRLKKEIAIPLLPLCAFMEDYWVNVTFAVIYKTFFTSV
jgi:hypothetical protein